MREYRGVLGRTEYEYTVERSRFIAYALRAVGEEEARAEISRIRDAHPFATHVCYGFVADREGNVQRFSDDGEPQGTAGIPILNVLKAEKLCETLLTVVRYFGGIKLGAGGLVRAYTAAASEAVRRSELRCFSPCREMIATANYPEVGALLKFLEAHSTPPISSVYGERAEIAFVVKSSEKEKFRASLIDALNGKISLSEGEEKFFPFPITE